MDQNFERHGDSAKKDSWKTIFLLSYQSLGVMYGDLSISPLYVFRSTFAEDIQHSETNEEIYGVLCFVFWTLTLVTLFKYVFVVLRADDNGEGGTFALYSLICRHAKVSLLPNRQVADEALSTYKLDCPLETKNVSRVKVLVLLGTCMVIGDGVHTPAISVLSAVSGLGFSLSKEHHLCKSLDKTRTRGWMSLGGILLCITGSEAMFADLGHFPYTAVQIAFTFMVYPALILEYMGQAAYLSKHHQLNDHFGFFVTVPENVRLPVVIIGIFASVVGSQAIISGTFSIINQSQSLGCFPRVKVIHTSEKIHGQIYIPEINWMLMILCIAVAVGFRDTKHMGNASGLAVMTVMLVTTCLTSLVIVLCWRKPPIIALAFLIFFGSIEILYFSASLIKFLEGAWVPIILAFILMTVMFVWHYATIKKYEFDLQNKVSLEWLLALEPSLGITRVPGIALVYSDLVYGIPPNFSRFITNLTAFHRVLVFVCVKAVPVPYVPNAERYLVGRVGPQAHRSYRCIVRLGYRDVHQDVDSFESELVKNLATFIRFDATDSRGSDSFSSEMSGSGECRLTVIGTADFSGPPAYEVDESAELGSVSAGFETIESMTEVIGVETIVAIERSERRVRFAVDDQSDRWHDETNDSVLEELEELWAAQQAGTAFILGKSYVKARQGSSFLKRLAINAGYNFLRQNCRGPDVALRDATASLLEVGMVYVV
ncbi:hypothetical protein MKX01_039716 [Papaver californicum]|nr:hypothetical protein MKX01_039716 [Papaver californicum]